MKPETNIKLQKVLTVIFLILVIATFVAYFLIKETPVIFITIGFTAIGVRIITYLLKHFNK